MDFQFQQFSICDTVCAMKVGTDGVLLGAWAKIRDAKTAIDVGTGSGLIALMIAQRNSDLIVDAIEIDADAAQQARENASKSPWSDRVRVQAISLAEFARNQHNHDQYDLVISNPPFFGNQQESTNQRRALARQTGFSMKEFLSSSYELASPRGRICMITPFDQHGKVTGLIKQTNWWAAQTVTVKPLPTSMPKRILWELSKAKVDCVESEIVLEEKHHCRSVEFAKLTSEFYLS